MKNYTRLLPLLLVMLFCTSFYKPIRSKKAAFRAHFRGTIYYSEGRYTKAEPLLRKAYQTIPDNFNFAMALAMCIGQNGNPEKGISLIKSSSRKLSTRDPEYHQKKTLSCFFEGMVQSYAGHYYKAIPLFRKAIELQEGQKNTRMMSIFENALGYVIMLNQGRGSHKKAGFGAHYHVHRRDMIQAHQHFATALEYDGENEVALENYTMLSDSLKLAKDVATNSRRIRERQYVSSSYNLLPANILRVLEMANYEEVLFLLDISGSMVMEKVTCMGADRFDVMKQTTLFLLETLDTTTNIGIGTIGGDCGTTPRLWIPTGSKSRNDLRWSIDFLVPDGTTPLLNMLQQAPELFSTERGRQKAIFLVSDGANICREEGEGICEWAENLDNIAINIFTFLDTHLNNIDPFSEYTCLADNTHGKILYLDNNRCSLEYFVFQLVEECLLPLPPMQKVHCWGKSIDNLWGIFPE